MEKIDICKRLKKVSDRLFSICFISLVAGILIIIWLGFIGFKIMITSLVLMTFFRMFSKAANSTIEEMMKEDN